jgi:sugar-specific transcriptional regulator TrmB
VSEKEIDMLTKLGLSVCQAKIYLTLLNTGEAPARLIADKSQVARPDVYRTLPTLQKMGLVEKALTTPTMFKASPVCEALPALLTLRIGEINQLQTDLCTFIDNFKNRQKKSRLEEDNEFVLFPGNQAFISRSKELAENSTKVMETIMPISRVLQASIFYRGTIQKARNQGIESRLITEEVDKTRIAGLQQIYSEIKCVPYRLSVGFTIYDRKQVLIVNSPKASFPKSGGLWSSNLSIVELAKNYFDNIWNTLQ